MSSKNIQMKKTVRIFWRIFGVGFILFIALVLMANFGVFGKMPSLSELENPSILQASEVYAEDGTLMGKYYTERGNRSNVKYSDVADSKQSIILQQVENGVAVRMAVLYLLSGKN